MKEVGFDYSRLPGDSTRSAFVWENSTMQNLGLAGGTYSDARGINNLGQVVGYKGTVQKAVIWNNGVAADLDNSTRYSWAEDINDTGWVVGDSVSAYGNYVHATLWRDGQVFDLGALGGTDSWANGINNSGQIVGNYAAYSFGNSGSEAFLWENGVMKKLASLGGVLSTSASDINNSGTIVGLSSIIINNSNVSHATLWKDGFLKDLGTLGGLRSEAVAINNLGVIVGSAYTASNQGHATIWENEIAIDLNSLITNSWLELYSALDINDFGQIVGYGRDSSGQYHSVLLTPDVAPVPEPSTMLLLGGGLAGLAFWRKRKAV